MRLFDAFAISGSGMTAERLRLDLIANNLANIHTTRTPEGGPYRRRFPVFAQHLETMKAGFKG
ncbi:MAG: flagellar basal body protein, partial [Firmicutes bacterium]|nr:flagellar basal body protein [Bacillota bacterium]